MDKNTVVGKTAKGLREASGKTSLLTRDTRDLLKEIDGRLSVGALLRKLPDWTEEEMTEAITLMLSDDFVRDLTPALHSQTPTQSGEPRPATKPAQKPPQDEPEEELDFTAMMAAEATAAQVSAEAAQRQAAAETQARLDAESKAKAAAEAQARAAAEAQAKARAEAEAKAKTQAEAQAKAVAEAQAKARMEAETKAKAAAEAQARAAAEAQAKAVAEAQAKAKAEVEARARAEAEARAKAAAEAQARAVAEAKAEAEARAKAIAEAEAKVKAEVEARARAEAEIQAKAAAEAQAKAVAEAQAKAKAEAEEQARAAAEARLAAEAQARAEAEAQAKAAEERKARAQAAAEELARQKAEEAEQARQEAAARAAAEEARRAAEEEARREAEAKARREAEEQARQEAAERHRREEEERAERAAEELARQHATEESEPRLEAARPRRKAEEVVTEEVDMPVAEKKERAPGNPMKWVKVGVLLLLLAIFGGLGAIHVMSFDGQKAQLEKLASTQFGQPVKIRSVGMALVPEPHWLIEGVSIGDDKQLGARQIKLITTLGGLFGSAGAFQSVRIESPTVTAEGLGWLLFGKASGSELKLGRVSASSVKLALPGFNLPAVNASAEIGDDGNWRSLSALSADKKFGVEVQSAGTAVDVEIKASVLTLLAAGGPSAVEDVVASGAVSRSGFDIREFKARVAGGSLTGKARVKWATMNAEGDLTAGQIDAAQLFAGLMERGRIEGRASFVLPLQEGDKPLASARLDGDFSMDNGTIAGVDLGRMLQSGGAGGQTQFTRMAGSVSHQGGRTQVRALRIDAGKLSASGTADVDEKGNLRGQLGVELNLGGERRRATAAVAGPFKAPYKNLEWTRR